jgi:type IV secretory pathway TraG/TraD family ATPase VirD4
MAAMTDSAFYWRQPSLWLVGITSNAHTNSDNFRAARTVRSAVDATHPSADITYFARTNHRHPHRIFGIRQADRRSHMYVIGKTGTGKSTLLKTMVMQDIAAGRGLALFDPHGDLVAEILAAVPEDRRAAIIHLDTPNANWTFNPLGQVAPGHEALAVAELIEVFKKIWVDDWGPRLEHLLRNVLFTLWELPGSTLSDIGLLLTEKRYREEIVEGLQNPVVREFWQKEYGAYSGPFRAVVVAPLQNKLGALLTDPRVRAIVGAERSSLDFEDVMDGAKVVLVNLSRGQIGEGPATLLGALLAARFGLAGLARADRPADQRRDFCLYLDEFQMFATESFTSMLAELRKYRLGLVLANQYLGQLNRRVQDAVVGNVGTLVSFRVSADDASQLAREFKPTFDAEDLVSLPNHNVCMRLMIDGEMSRPFSAKTVDPNNWYEQ